MRVIYSAVLSLLFSLAANAWSPPTCNYSCPVFGSAIHSCQCLSAHSEKEYNKYTVDPSYHCNGSLGGSISHNHGISFYVTHENGWHSISLPQQQGMFYYQRGTCRYASYCRNNKRNYVKERPLVISVIWDQDCNMAPASVLQNLNSGGNFGGLKNENGRLVMSDS